MKNLKRIGLYIALICVLATAAFAGDPNSPPCTDPGITNTPPCVSAPATADGSVVPGSTNSPPALGTETNYSITEVAVDLLINTLLLF
jgi:hypothetical protein